MDEVTGSTRAHLCGDESAESLGAFMHTDVVAPFRELRRAAAEEGFDLRVSSGYRGFDRQCSIWNRKVSGDLAVLDSEARPLDIEALGARDLVYAILRWSALPGGSRHHWGTDLDVFDEAARPRGYEVDLVPAEVEPGGMFGPFHDWFDRRVSEGRAFGFFRPYDQDRGGVAPERWHLSHGPTAAVYEALLTPERLRARIAASNMLGREVVFEHFDDIFERFVINTNRNPE